ncbi:MAG: type VI secretion system baseplate subunit TssG, partial [Chthoniobacterales bacterium]|nr:type VI secretion system baseplate subunit TssG [Chthoniobacterales bacterium]
LIAKYAQPECLEAIISEYFHIPVKIQNWAGHWLGLPEGERCKLGRQNPTAQLGVGALLGERVWDVASRFRVVLGPMNHKRFRDFLPSQRSRRRLELILQYLTGDSWEIEIQLLLEGPLTPPFKLGETGFLGWDTWLETTHPQKPRTECIFTN